MYCSACGHALVPNQPVCSQCGRPVAVAPVPPVPGFTFELTTYVSRLRALGVVWYIYGGFVTVFGLIGVAFLDSWFHGRLHYWVHGPIPHMWMGPALVHFAWLLVLVRGGLAFAAGYGLTHRTPWGRIVAIVSAFVNIVKIPIGTGIGIWTLITLMGYRNTTLYDHIAEV